MTKGIIFAADSGKEFYPITQVVRKELLSIHDKPMIYYPLWALMMAGIRDFLIVSSPRELRSLMELLGNGCRLGIRISYGEQPAKDGIAHSLVAAEHFIEDDPVCVILSDTILHGELCSLRDAVESPRGATVFTCPGRPQQPDARATEKRNRCQPSTVCCIQAGFVEEAAASPHADSRPVVEFRGTGDSLRLQVEDTATPCDHALVGLYLFDEKVVRVARGVEAKAFRQQQALQGTATAGSLRPGQLLQRACPAPARLNMVDICREYFLRGELRVQPLGSDTAWLRAETEADLLEAANYIANAEKRQGLKVGCIEEAAFRMGFIDAARLERVACDLPLNGYREYLLKLARTAHVIV